MGDCATGQLRGGQGWVELCPACPEPRAFPRRVDPVPHDAPKPPGYTRFVCVSDTHSRTDPVQMPYGDVLIHAGDFTELGLPSEVKKFNEWLGRCRARRAGTGGAWRVLGSMGAGGVGDIGGFEARMRRGGAPAGTGSLWVPCGVAQGPFSGLSPRGQGRAASLGRGAVRPSRGAQQGGIPEGDSPWPETAWEGAAVPVRGGLRSHCLEI